MHTCEFAPSVLSLFPTPGTGVLSLHRTKGGTIVHVRFSCHQKQLLKSTKASCVTPKPKVHKAIGLTELSQQETKERA